MKKVQPYCVDTFQKMYKAGINIAMGPTWDSTRRWGRTQPS
jgi:hypothetical protein